MAPNNALRRQKPPSTSSSVLGDAVVAGRGYGTKDGAESTAERIDAEIQAFLSGAGKLSARCEARSFFTVFTFITRLPGPTWVDHHPGFLMRGMAYFTVVGSLVGAFVGVVFDVSHTTLPLPPTVAACFSTAASMWLTGCFHEDGLADATDGIGGGWSRTQILDIMSDTRLGTYGCASLVVYLLAKVSLVASLGASRWEWRHCGGAAPALLVSHTLARWTAPFLIRHYKYVDDGTGPKKYYTFFREAKKLVSRERLAFASLASWLVVWLTFGLSGGWSLVLVASVWATVT